MNYIITENQLRIITENEVLDKLLKKIKDFGLESLTDTEKYQLDKISKGEDFDEIDNSEGDENINFDPFFSFFDFVPNYETINVDGKDYEVLINDEDSFLSLVVIGDNTEIYITPFYENSGDIKIETVEGKTLKLKSDIIPSDVDLLKEYIDKFYSVYIPKIIRKVLS
jgi:hypothetical protein